MWERIVSCARGGVVNEEDVLIALNQGILSSCALDVFENEPGNDPPSIKSP